MFASKTKIKSSLLFALILISFFSFSYTQKGKPNIMWILVEDASCHISCYGEEAINTPNIDQLATEGVRFENAFVTAPVCSPARSAFVMGMYQNTIGAHNHRSQVMNGKGGGNTDYYETYTLPTAIPIASKLFEMAGYYTTNEMAGNYMTYGKKGKEDYNFLDKDTYVGTSWKDSPEGTPFFSQIQLMGGKNRSRQAETEAFNLPPYYYEDEFMRDDWKEYLGSWLDTDEEIRQIVLDLKAEGVYDNTLIFFLTDHGISHLRGKQFLYDEGTKVPLIVKLPDSKRKGTVRKDLVTHIDVLPTSLAFAGLTIPENMQGEDFFSQNYEQQQYVFSFRDRCDETTEIIRSVRSDKFKYIRNFLSYRPHAQRNQYKDGKGISQHMRELYENNKLSELQSSFYQTTRPPEELYDLESDPYEINNLANDPKYQSQLENMRSVLFQKLAEINDPGLIPEPILEDLGRQYDNKYTAMKQPEFEDIQERLIKIIEAGEKGDIDYLVRKANSSDPSERYWAASWLGVNKPQSAKPLLSQLTADNNPTVRIGAQLALYKIDPTYNPIPDLAKELQDDNLIVGMYAMNAIEQTGIRNEEVKSVAEKASGSEYEYTVRFGKYLEDVCQ